MSKVSSAFAKRLEECVPPERIASGEPLSKHTTFQIGGPAEYFVTVSTAEELGRLLALLREVKKPYFPIGRGSNLLVGDKGFRGVVFRLAGELETCKVCGLTADTGKLIAGAGVSLAALANAARDASLTGLEFASGIPGSLGGGLVMNAGAYGGELKDVVDWVEAVDLGEATPAEGAFYGEAEDTYGKLVRLTKEELRFGYRTSVAKEKKLLFLRAGLTLQRGDKEAVEETMRSLAAKRREKQPLEYPSAGSTFKRPEGSFAGKLIMEAGLRGYVVGGAQVSEKHCGFIVNTGGARAADVRQLMEEVVSKVEAHAGVRLAPEIILLGDF